MVAPELIVANQIINFQPPNRLLRALIGQPEATAPRSPPTVMGPLTKKALFFQTSSSPQSSSKSMVIHLFYILLIVLEHTMILKTTKSSKSHKISTFILPHHQPLKICFSCSLIEIHQILCIHFIKHSLNESRQQPVMQTLHRFN